ncbi:caspase domain-containing protein [Larkinella insperata]|uniref:Caspase domain-containing protein n=1 Tax=Larkinella insperata TaxID=332158 RepID=A0ABW3QJE0_9BACT|nr:caspase family protein [Larkinella insperata]
MKKCAVIIGVDKTGGLPKLNAAGSGAIDFANWANKQGFEVTLLTDANDRPVSISDIKKAVKGYVESQTYEQLIIYFSGHGILRAPEYELWLLTGSPDDPNEAVNLTSSILLARNARIKHVVFISDACRSRPTTTELSQVTGSTIFPNRSPHVPRPTVDVFYATLPGDPALEVPPDEAVVNYRGIFTECMLKGLNGLVSQVIIEAGQPPQLQQVVPSWQLKNYLESEVPLAASAVHIKLKQEPDIRVESHHPPSFLSLLSTNPQEHTPVLPISPDKEIKLRGAAYGQIIESLQASAFSMSSEQAMPTVEAVLSRPEHSILTKSVNRIVSAEGRPNFETRTGFTVVGAKVKATMAETEVDVFEENGNDHIRVPFNFENGQPNQSILIQFEDKAILLAVLPGFIGTVVLEDKRVVTVNYTPCRSSDKYDEYQEVKGNLDKRRAFVAVAARNGSFRLTDDMTVQGAQYLRSLKSIDPTLGLYAAYAYTQSGLMQEVRSVFEYMVRDKIHVDEYNINIPVLFDVALLAGAFSESTFPPIAPACPMLMQGWAYMDPYKNLLNPAILAASRHLLPGLWTTFSEEGLSILQKAMNTKALI